jgi:hypothetical protein
MTAPPSRVRYEGRRYRDGDASAINSLYREITGIERSLESFHWQWFDAPGGPGECWLIEALSDEAAPMLIGHHGIMPVRFSRDTDDLLFGKTENTFVHPDHRERIVYPRFEKRFASQYESRFDALFSTMGPLPALRQRAAQGYQFVSSWEQHLIPVHSASTAVLAMQFMHARWPRIPLSVLARLFNRVGRAFSRRRLGNGQVFSDREAATCPFFGGFWNDVRSRYPVSPRRDSPDLAWRFWNNPNYDYTTLVLDGIGRDAGYVVLRRVDDHVPWGVVEDIVAAQPDSNSFAALIDAACEWARDLGLGWLLLTTTADGAAASGLRAGLRSRSQPLARHVLEARRERPPMPRKVTPSGRGRHVPAEPWFVTSIVALGGQARPKQRGH